MNRQIRNTHIYLLYLFNNLKLSINIFKSFTFQQPCNPWYSWPAMLFFIQIQRIRLRLYCGVKHMRCACPTNGSRREKTCLRRFANNKGADQPAHPRSLISAFVIRLLESTTSRLITSEISIF